MGSASFPWQTDPVRYSERAAYYHSVGFHRITINIFPYIEDTGSPGVGACLGIKQGDDPTNSMGAVGFCDGSTTIKLAMDK